MSTSPQPQNVIGDASTRTPTASACASPYMRSMITGSDASARTPFAGARVGAWASTDRSWGVMSSPAARTSLSAQGIVSTSPVAATGVTSFPAQSACPAGSAAADTLRSLLGPAGMSAGDDLAAKLRAAAPDTYED